ncbi:hypothetical protein MLD38_037396 [Melastoma candidum]|uniref:Uncharacterized protein n=1 Tax=Melastoma candidum TaxID=119954 RepID=A0ACB9LMX7_9MYRT|nr:hypothetical protein MLD38_037396 [Melastoma candidum]
MLNRRSSTALFYQPPPSVPSLRHWSSGACVVRKAKKISEEDYINAIKSEIRKVVKLQEDLDIDVLVHGELEKNDMVEYFGEQLSGFAFTVNGWISMREAVDHFQ